jgi:hypothetical protein
MQTNDISGSAILVSGGGGGLPVAHVSKAKRGQLLAAMDRASWGGAPPQVPAGSRLVSVKLVDEPMAQADPHTNAVLILGPKDTVKTASKAYFERYSGGIIGITTYSPIVNLGAHAG